MIAYSFRGQDPLTKAELIRQIQSTPKLSFPFSVLGKLTTSFTAEVDRTISDDPDVEYVVLTNEQGTKVTVERNTAVNDKGRMGVSCFPNGERAPVYSVNIEFRDYSDPYTDRGLVWVTPGNPATVQIQLRRLPEEKELQAILDGAERAIEKNLLQLFSAAN